MSDNDGNRLAEINRFVAAVVEAMSIDQRGEYERLTGAVEIAQFAVQDAAADLEEAQTKLKRSQTAVQRLITEAKKRVPSDVASRGDSKRSAG